ncbi:extracellular solute-binding protein [Paenibacillus aceris]|uniref:Aldouronate transport system substrate-binding protein n=1 Tax=Paenibacillus aceris TaxID=869555 RepID=A0ABS4I2B9_9BACL|nr:extracellular solute-binding protein [Paenibacillus aceris]MBP1965053.1 putative aldouronate transport system substrate-binding protein [Paenibacillus aceris]NHW33038.1 extracellular solute-binding protein [Paenibacillus aceris]
MKKMNKMIAVVCTSCLTGALLAGCSSSNEKPGDVSKQASGSEKSNAQKAPVTFNMFFNLGIPEYPENGGAAKDKVIGQMDKAGIQGIDYKVNLLAGDEYKTKLNLMVSSGEMPDYFSVDSTLLAQYVSQGLVKPLDDLITKAPNLMKVVPKERWEGVKYDGKIYAIPYGVRSESFNSPNTAGVLIRQDWLDNLNLKAPTTLDELHDVLKAFTLNDPDKNGQKDTYGLGGNKTSVFSSVFAAFGIGVSSSSGSMYWTEKDGKIIKSFLTPEAKQALAVLQQWYKEGLIDPEFPVMEAKQGEARVVNSKVGIFEGDAFLADPKGSGVPEALVKATPSAKLTMITPPKGPGGKLGMPEVNPFAGGGLRAISAKAKDPERLLQLLDWSVSEEANGGINLVTYGEENVDYTYDKGKNLITQTSSVSDLYKKGFSNPIRFVQVTDRRWTNDAVRAALDISSKYLVKNALWKSVPAELDYPDLEKKLWTEYFVKIVTGVWSIDKFDEFVQKYYQQGGQKIEQQANELWKQK